MTQSPTSRPPPQSTTSGQPPAAQVAAPVVAQVVAQAATAAATAAADRAGVAITPIVDAADAHRAADVLSRIWNADQPDRTVMPAELIRSLVYADAYGALATAADTAPANAAALGAAVGFLGEGDRGRYLHSFIAGVVAHHRDGSVGFALKQHQRAWALGRGLTRVEWTFDPLVRRNAIFNLVKLGATATRFHRDFYGAMGDGVNAGDLSDWILIEWELGSPSAVAASERRPATIDVGALDAAPRVSLRVATDGAPEVGDRGHLGQGAVELVQVPADIVALRAADRDLALRWRHALRDTLGAACAAGARIGGISRDGWYVVRHNDTAR